MSTNLKEPKLFEASTLKEAYEKASLEYNCSVTNIKSELVQSPSNGFLGFFKKNAIIKVLDIIEDSINIKQEDKQTNTNHKVDFSSNDKIINEIEEKVNDLFSNLCYKIEKIKVSMYDKNTVLVHFSGEDSALLIGKEGYRYKAISYILFNWIKEQYGFMLRLEIAEFLHNQEENIEKYIESIIDEIKEQEYYKTKILDGILIHIALTKLRKELPNKYITVKQNINQEKYILINEYKHK